MTFAVQMYHPEQKIHGKPGHQTDCVVKAPVLPGESDKAVHTSVVVVGQNPREQDHLRQICFRFQRGKVDPGYGSSLLYGDIGFCLGNNLTAFEAGVVEFT